MFCEKSGARQKYSYHKLRDKVIIQNVPSMYLIILVPLFSRLYLYLMASFSLIFIVYLRLDFSSRDGSVALMGCTSNSQSLSSNRSGQKQNRHGRQLQRKSLSLLLIALCKISIHGMLLGKFFKLKRNIFVDLFNSI